MSIKTSPSSSSSSSSSSRAITTNNTGPTGAIQHAKPVIIQGAWLAYKNSMKSNKSRDKEDPSLLAQFKQYAPQMEALLAYWGRPPRLDNTTGLRMWYDQMESGSDNLVTSTCPSKYSPWCWR